MSGVFQYDGISLYSDYNGKYGTPDSTASLKAITATGANAVEIVPTEYTTSVTSSDIHADPNGTESDADVIKAINDAHADGLQVLLKPHVDPGDGNYRGAYAPTDVAAWFHNYDTMITHYATVAQQTHSEMFSIGCEFGSLSGAQYQTQWNQIIADVAWRWRPSRSRCSSPMTPGAAIPRMTATCTSSPRRSTATP
jgi:hypothetical protein